MILNRQYRPLAAITNEIFEQVYQFLDLRCNVYATATVPTNIPDIGTVSKYIPVVNPAILLDDPQLF